MPTDNSLSLSLRERRNQRIRADFARLFEQGLRVEIILFQLSVRYYLMPGTLEHIAFRRGHYKVATSATNVATSI